MRMLTNWCWCSNFLSLTNCISTARICSKTFGIFRTITNWLEVWERICAQVKWVHLWKIKHYQRHTNIHYNVQQIFCPLKQGPPVDVPLPFLSLQWLTLPCQTGSKNHEKYLSGTPVQLHPITSTTLVSNSKQDGKLSTHAKLS
jgi:hypothetical protein